ncbi:hypothetical protein NHX12_030741, partial [Muraenolepis orangiensis]
MSSSSAVKRGSSESTPPRGVLREHILKRFISQKHWHSLERPTIPTWRLGTTLRQSCRGSLSTPRGSSLDSRRAVHQRRLRAPNVMQDVRQAEQLMLAMTLTDAPIQEGQNQQEWQVKLPPTPLLWVSRFMSSLPDQVQWSEKRYQSTVGRVEEVRRRENVGLLPNAKVMGMTTTGAAKFHKILQEVCPRLVIVEEAAEVLEAHTIINQECQHLILIGDHQQ